MGVKLVVTTCEDWTAHVEPRITGSGWIVDYDMRRIVGARCLDGLCILASRCVGRNVSYIDGREYVAEILPRALGYELVDF
ncbi:MAG: hypothetical protein QXP98_09150 [Thermoproteus sp.]